MNKRIFFVIFDCIMMICLFFSLALAVLCQYYITLAPASSDDFRTELKQKVDSEIASTPDLRAIDRENAEKRGDDLVNTQTQKFEEISVQNKLHNEFVRNISAGVAIYFALLLLVMHIRKRRKNKQ